MEPPLSVCIVSYNTSAFLERCLSSIYEGVVALGSEVIVVDNASSDDSPRMVAEKFPQAILICNPCNLHFTKGMNQAIERSRGQFVLALNPDTEVPSGALEEMIRFLGSHPAMGAIGCRLLNPDGSLQRTGNRFPSLIFLIFETLGLNSRYPWNPVHRKSIYADWGRATERDVDAISGACLLVRRDVVERVGLLDEGFRMYFEEVDWCHRICDAGWRIGFDPKAHIVHLGGQSAKQLPRSVADEIFWSSLLYYTRKYHGTVAEMALRAILTARRSVSSLTRSSAQVEPTSSRERAPKSLDLFH